MVVFKVIMCTHLSRIHNGLFRTNYKYLTGLKLALFHKFQVLTFFLHKKRLSLKCDSLFKFIR